jgi:F420H(2)-dependent quinone reductase
VYGSNKARRTAMNVKRWYYRGGRPNRVARVLDRCTSALYGLGVAPDYLVTLEVVGRRSGRTTTLPLVMAIVGGERYLVSMLGERANWVRNVWAARGEVTIRHGRREEVRLEEVAVDRRAPVLKAYLLRAPNARAHLPVHKDAPLAEFERAAHRFPVFRVTASHAVVPAASEEDYEAREPVQ